MAAHAISSYRNLNNYCNNFILFILACISFYWFTSSYPLVYHAVNTFTPMVFIGTLLSTYSIVPYNLITFSCRYFIHHNLANLHLYAPSSIHLIVFMLRN